VDEVDLNPVDLGRELRERVQLRLGLPPVVVGCPVAGELLERPELDSLRAIRDELLAGPACRGDAATKFGQLVVRNGDVKGADCAVFGACFELREERGGKWAGTLSSQSLRLLSSVHGDKPLEPLGEEKDIGSS
jgi:hypothetical protein